MYVTVNRFLCVTIYSQTALAFLADSSVAMLCSQMVVVRFKKLNGVT